MVLHGNHLVALAVSYLSCVLCSGVFSFAAFELTLQFVELQCYCLFIELFFFFLIHVLSCVLCRVLLSLTALSF